jgi:hypothetical protein
MACLNEKEALEGAGRCENVSEQKEDVFWERVKDYGSNVDAAGV